MPSPFPGMNPYLEQRDAWHEFHEGFVNRAGDALEVQIGEHYIVKTDSHIYLEDESEDSRRLIGRHDVGIVTAQNPLTAASGASVLAPMHVQAPVEEVEEESFLEIRDREHRQLITVIELLSPANKRPGENRDQYLAKRRYLLRSTSHLVEIDLLRGWPRMPLVPAPQCDYCTIVSRFEDRPKMDCWPLLLRDPLPRIPVPLRAPDPDVFLDLQELLQQIYDAKGFRKYIYRTPPDPPLSPEDAEWAKQFVPGRVG
jgi:hypothetical protein